MIFWLLQNLHDMCIWDAQWKFLQLLLNKVFIVLLFTTSNQSEKSKCFNSPLDTISSVIGAYVELSRAWYNSSYWILLDCEHTILTRNIKVPLLSSKCYSITHLSINIFLFCPNITNVCILTYSITAVSSDSRPPNPKCLTAIIVFDIWAQSLISQQGTVSAQFWKKILHFVFIQFMWNIGVLRIRIWRILLNWRPRLNVKNNYWCQAFRI